VALAADTIIHTLRGPYPVYRLAAMEESVYCFQWDGGKITVGRIFVRTEPRTEWTRRVVLDDGTSVRMTSDQVVLTRDGGMVDARFVVANTRVMPLYIRVRKKDKHPLFKQLGEHRRSLPAACDRKAWRSVARMVYEWSTEGPILPGVRVRHQDGNPENCEPTNLATEGQPRRGNKSKLRRMGERAWGVPNNHVVIGQEQFDEEIVYDVHPQVGDTFAAGGVFMMGAHRGA
jgi:hypothetical protein